MRILHIDTEMTWRGGENQLRLLLAGLAASGIESVVAVRPGSAAAARLQALAPVTQIPMRGGFDLKAAWRLAKLTSEQQIDLIDAHTANAHSLALLAAKVGGHKAARLVVHRRVDYPPGTGPINRLKYQSASVDRYVAISGAIRDVLVTWGLDAARVSVVRSAVDLSGYKLDDRGAAKAELAARTGANPSLTFLGNASALTEQKGYDTLLAALSDLKRQGTPFHAFIAGDGALKSSLEQTAKELGLTTQLTWLGFIADVPRFLSGLDILTMPSRFEGLGTLLLEAAGAGTVVAATRVGGIPEVVQDGTTGSLSPVGDHAAFANQVARLIADPALRERLAKAARRHVDREFSVDAMVSGNLDVYRQVLELSRQPG